MRTAYVVFPDSREAVRVPGAQVGPFWSGVGLFDGDSVELLQWLHGLGWEYQTQVMFKETDEHGEGQRWSHDTIVFRPIGDVD